jgi:hypothetical protein
VNLNQMMMKILKMLPLMEKMELGNLKHKNLLKLRSMELLSTVLDFGNVSYGMVLLR